MSYAEYGNQGYAWSFENLSLCDINLIVGKNSTGKSRLLRVINGIARLIDGTLSPQTLLTGRYKLILRDVPDERPRKRPRPPKPEFVYAFEIEDRKVQSESLDVGGVNKLTRGKTGRGQLFYEKHNDFIDVQLPDANLAATSRRDLEQHSYFEDLYAWAKGVRYYEIARTETATFTSFEGKGSIPVDAVISAPLQAQLHLAYKVAKDRFGQDFLSAVRRDIRRVGYEIKEFGMMPITGINLPPAILGSIQPNAAQLLYVVEADVPKKIPQNEMSDGLLRALATLIFFHFIRLQKNGGCFLIDDIGEGLDFERSANLITVLIELAKTGHVQLIMTSNDRFVMNRVPLEYWSVIVRHGGVVSVFNRQNSAERFNEFEEFGFSNFDFFAKQFFSNDIETTKQ